MYLNFYKLEKHPFHITPDPEFLFLSASHREAISSIVYGIEQRKGFIAITGEVGVGKTTILRSYLQQIDPNKFKIIYIFNTALSFHQLLKQIVFELGIPVANEDAYELVNRLFQYIIREYNKKQSIIFIIDEAQNMPTDTLERLRLLSNLETAEDKLLQIILVGQPELETKLEMPELRQLKQRIAVYGRINPLGPDESMAYIVHRLMKASTFYSPIFTQDAMNIIIEEARGIPRVINILCDNALITGLGYQRNPIDSAIVEEVVADINGGKPRQVSSPVHSPVSRPVSNSASKPVSGWRRALNFLVSLVKFR
ncbi:MAG: AAA family ATPase [Syntrophobacteraceae bacterium]|jgi:general secretion pathway protein A